MPSCGLRVCQTSYGSMLLPALAACGSPRGPAQTSESRSGHGASVMTVVKGGTSGFRNPIREVVRDSIRWHIIWDSLYYDPKPASPPPVDFQREMLVVAVGPSSGVGDSVVIARLTPDRGNMRVRVVLYRGCHPAQLATKPFHVVRVPRAQQEEAALEDHVVTEPECIE